MNKSNGEDHFMKIAIEQAEIAAENGDVPVYFSPSIS